jgi:hypothetical protein
LQILKYVLGSDTSMPDGNQDKNQGSGDDQLEPDEPDYQLAEPAEPDYQPAEPDYQPAEPDYQPAEPIESAEPDYQPHKVTSEVSMKLT